jgi:hypothetical protein
MVAFKKYDRNFLAEDVKGRYFAQCYKKARQAIGLPCIKIVFITLSVALSRQWCTRKHL